MQNGSNSITGNGQELELERNARAYLENVFANSADAIGIVDRHGCFTEWNKIESYIKDRTEAEFSHSICPACIKEHYPDLDLNNDE